MEFSKGLQRLYQSCKHSITHVNLIYSTPKDNILNINMTWHLIPLLLIIMRYRSLPPAPHAALLHLLSGSGAGPGAECGAAAGQHHPAQPDLHPGTEITHNLLLLLILECLLLQYVVPKPPCTVLLCCSYLKCTHNIWTHHTVHNWTSLQSNCPCTPHVYLSVYLFVQPLMQRKQEHEKRRKEIKEHWIRAKRKLVRSILLRLRAHRIVCLLCYLSDSLIRRNAKDLTFCSLFCARPSLDGEWGEPTEGQANLHGPLRGVRQGQNSSQPSRGGGGRSHSQVAGEEETIGGRGSQQGSYPLPPTVFYTAVYSQLHHLGSTSFFSSVWNWDDDFTNLMSVLIWQMSPSPPKKSKPITGCIIEN